MNIFISNTDRSPIYSQIYSQIKMLILNGELKEGDVLPSMRTLAKELRISIITTKRAYEELERDGFTQSFTGKGSFVKTMNDELIKEEHIRQLEELLEKVIEKAAICKISHTELCEMLKLMEENV